MTEGVSLLKQTKNTVMHVSDLCCLEFWRYKVTMNYHVTLSLCINVRHVLVFQVSACYSNCALHGAGVCMHLLLSVSVRITFSSQKQLTKVSNWTIVYVDYVIYLEGTG
jgi:hypothetical protein